jgi:hypothetical protein
MAEQSKRWHAYPKPQPQASPPDTIHEICRRYVATAAILAKLLGLPLTEAFIKEYRESIACCFIESGRTGVRLPPTVALPPLVTTTGQGEPVSHDTPKRDDPVPSAAEPAPVRRIPHPPPSPCPPSSRRARACPAAGRSSWTWRPPSSGC